MTFGVQLGVYKLIEERFLALSEDASGMWAVKCLLRIPYQIRCWLHWRLCELLIQVEPPFMFSLPPLMRCLPVSNLDLDDRLLIFSQRPHFSHILVWRVIRMPVLMLM
jgi:hypothetical protein